MTWGGVSRGNGNGYDMGQGQGQWQHTERDCSDFFGYNIQRSYQALNEL